MILLPILAALGASAGWATGVVLAHGPARQLGAFEFTRIQLIACSAILAGLCSGLGYWSTVAWAYWPVFGMSICIGIVLGNLAMIECLRRGGPRRTKLLLSLKAPLVAGMALIWLGETPSAADLLGAGFTLCGVGLAVGFGGKERAATEAIDGTLWTVVVLGLAATACQGFGFLVMKPAMLAASAIRLLGAAFVISIVALWPRRRHAAHPDMTPALLGRTILPGFIGYGVSSTLLLYAFANFDAGVAAVLGSLSPVLVLPILWLKNGTRPHPTAIIGAGLAVVGTAIIVLF